MNFIMKIVQLLVCKPTPKSTETDYYLDPKLLLLGSLTFKPSKLQNKLSKEEFIEMREEMKKIGGGWLTAAKTFLILFLIYSPPCTILGAGTMIYNIFFDGQDFKIPWVVNICGMLFPNLLFQIFCVICMYKACQNLKPFFALKKNPIYSSRGIKWISYNHLLYIRISLIDPEARKSVQSAKNSVRNSVRNSYLPPPQVIKSASLDTVDDEKSNQITTR